MIKRNGSLTYGEIYMQPDSFRAINDSLPEIYKVLDQVFHEKNAYKELLFTGCGTSFYLAQTAAYAFATATGLRAKAVPCSELFFFPEAYVGNDKPVLVLPITRKSYTTEVRMAIDKVRSFPGVTTLALTCDADSSKYNDYVLLSPDTAEESIVMTRSFTSMVYLAVIMALYVGDKKEQIQEMRVYPAIAEALLIKMDGFAKRIIEENPNLNLFVTLGQGIYYGVANECMNKMKEMGIVNSEAYYTLEYRHGPMSLADETTMVLALINPATASYDAALLAQMKGYGAITVALGDHLETEAQGADYSFSMETGLNHLQTASLAGFIGQLLGYYIAKKKNLDADSPRNLSQAIILEKE